MKKVSEIITTLHNEGQITDIEKQVLDYYWVKIQEYISDLDIKAVHIPYIGHVQKNNKKAVNLRKATETRIKIQENKPFMYKERAQRKINHYKEIISKIDFLINNTKDYAEKEPIDLD